MRGELARRGVGYVLAIAKDHTIVTGIGPRKAIELAVRLPARSWQRISGPVVAVWRRLRLAPGG
jgi:hypothetical protein